ncbi:MAG: ParB/RepB/Spo0J family partition protein [Planctomycetota bacterium]
MNDKNTNQKSVQLEELPIADIVPSGDNPRVINEKGTAFIELTESIRANGVIVPVHVRVHPEQKKRFELLAGERRWRASTKAERPLIPALNHGEINDKQAFEITFTENYARVDLTPLEQGKAVVTLLEKYKGESEAVASKMGRSIKWVRQREALGTKLSKEWKTALTEDSMVSNWTAGHLQLIARLPEKMQNEFLKYYLSEDIPTISDLDKHIAKEMQLIQKAPFDVVRSGCLKCQKRTSCRPGLFDDTLEPKELKKNDRCLDSSCWKDKTKAWLIEEFDAKKKEFPNLIAITTEGTSYNEDRVLQQTWPNFYECHRFNQARQKDKGAIPGFIIFGKALGTILWVKLKGSAAESKSTKSKGKPTPLKERRQMLDNKRGAKFLQDLKEAIVDKKVSDLVAPDKTTMVMSLAHIFGVHECYSHDKYSFYYNKGKLLEAWKDHEKLLAADLKTIRETLWENIRPKLEQSLVYAGPITQTPPERVKAAEKLASIFGIDYKAMQKQITTEMKEPSSWAKLNESGTPKKTKKAKKKPAKAKKPAAGKKKNGGCKKC